MEPRDSLAIAALVISLASLFLSARNASFSRSAKEAELRAAVLGKAAEVSSRLAHISLFKAEMYQHAATLKDAERLERYGIADRDQLQNEADILIRRLSNYPTSSAVKVYEVFYHRLQNINGRLINLEGLYEVTLNEYLKIKERTSPAP